MNEIHPALVKPHEAGGKRRTNMWKALAWIAASVALFLTAVLLDKLEGRGIYIYLAPGVNSRTLCPAFLLLAVRPLINGTLRLLAHAENRLANRSWLALAKFFAWLTTLCCIMVILLSALFALFLLPQASHVLKSPQDDRTVLIVHGSEPLSMLLPVYKPLLWPVHTKTSKIPADEGSDPFSDGQHKETWTDAGLELKYHHSPQGALLQHFIEYPR